MKDNIALTVGVALPLVFVAALSVAIFLPALFVNPGYDFLYIESIPTHRYNNAVYYQNTYIVENGHIALKPIPLRNEEVVKLEERPTLYRYDVQTDTSHEITFEKARNFTLDPGPSSPDNYTMRHHSGNYDFFSIFGSQNDNGYFISKDSMKKKLNGLSSRRNIELIGWIK